MISDCKDTTFFSNSKKKLYLCNRFDREKSPLRTENQERCRSGRTGRSRKPLTPFGVPGFESLPLRREKKQHQGAAFFIVRMFDLIDRDSLLVDDQGAAADFEGGAK